MALAKALQVHIKPIAFATPYTEELRFAVARCTRGLDVPPRVEDGHERAVPDVLEHDASIRRDVEGPRRDVVACVHAHALLVVDLEAGDSSSQTA